MLRRVAVRLLLSFVFFSVIVVTSLLGETDLLKLPGREGAGAEVVGTEVFFRPTDLF